MAGNQSFNDDYSVYVDAYLPGFADNYTKHSKLWDFMKNKQGVRKDRGGVTLTEGIEYAMNGQFIRYTLADSWGTLPSNPFLTRAQYLRRQAASTIVATRTEELEKTDAVTREDLIARKVINAGKTLANGLAGDLYSDGSQSNQIDGLQKIVADTPTNSVGGIDPQTTGNEFWANYTAEIDLTSDKMYDAIQDMFVGTTRGTDKIDYIVADNGMFNAFDKELTAQQRFVDAGKFNAGSLELSFKGIPVVFDEAMNNQMGGSIPEDHCYGINTDYIAVRPHVDCDMIKRERVNSFNSDVASMAILWAGACTCSGRAFQGVIVNDEE
ncbi:MAG: phage major capsid protein [Methanobrevibacter sp.]|nr:phage major capsid protein [Methanobrevibacter sp.]